MQGVNLKNFIHSLRVYGVLGKNLTMSLLVILAGGYHETMNPGFPPTHN